MFYVFCSFRSYVWVLQGLKWIAQKCYMNVTWEDMNQ